VTSAPVAALGVDVGTTNTKVALAVLGDSVREERILSVATPSTGAGLQAAVLGAIRDAVADSPYAIAAIGIASMAETGAVTGPDGEPRGELLRWADGDARVADRLVASVGAVELYAATGVPVASKSPLAHWSRLADDGDPRLIDGRWLGADALVTACLTGEAVTDHTLAARTMAYRVDVQAETFDPALLGLVGLTPEQFPRVAVPGARAGGLTQAAASALGLAAGTPVVVAGHDHAVGAWAAGVREPGDAADSVGTAEALFRVVDRVSGVPRDAARRAGMSVARTVDGHDETLIAGNPTAGALVQWAFAELFPGADRGQVLAQTRLRCEGRIDSFLLPYLRGRQSPAPDPAATLRLAPAQAPIGLAGIADPAEALTAVLAGLALQLAWMDAAQTEIAGPRRPELAVLGGPGAGNDAWWHLKRRLIPGILRRVDAAEPVATGAAMLAAHRVAGLTTSLPLGSADTVASTGDPALLGAFVDAATHHDKEPV
jgi:xylulokinase